jgi:hypothetical protein
MGWDFRHHTLICHDITQSAMHRDRDSYPSFYPQYLTNPIPHSPSPSPRTHHRLDQTFTATCPESERLDLQSWTCSLIAVCVQKLSLEEMAPVTGMYSCSTYCTYCYGFFGCLCFSPSIRHPEWWRFLCLLLLNHVALFFVCFSTSFFSVIPLSPPLPTPLSPPPPSSISPYRPHHAVVAASLWHERSEGSERTRSTYSTHFMRMSSLLHY